MIKEEEATGELKEIYTKVKDERGKLSNILKIHSLLPKTMLTHLDFYMSIMRSEEHTSELQSHSFISYAVFCLKKKNK